MPHTFSSLLCTYFKTKEICSVCDTLAVASTITSTVINGIPGFCNKNIQNLFFVNSMLDSVSACAFVNLILLHFWGAFPVLCYAYSTALM